MIIQAAGVKDEKELDILLKAGFTCIGFPLRLPVNKEDTTEEEAKRLMALVPPGVGKVLITYMEKAKPLLDLTEYLGADYLQIHGNISLPELIKIRKSATRLKLIKSLVVTGDNLQELESTIGKLESAVDFFITDTFDPATGASGATGKAHDWNISKRLVRMSSRPVILAGGLTPDNVADAVKFVRPAGVDVHTGIEGPSGEKDAELARRFVANTTAV